MRPPYFSYNANTLQTLGGLGYHVIHADIDTLDWQYNTPQTVETAAIRFQDGVSAGGSISLAHDVHQTTANTLVNRMVQIVQQRGLRGT
jgi:peptidoglycan/xylan/chitin deacetylase (PgdA/CDA1 family)